MTKIIILVLILTIKANYSSAQLHLSPVNTADCVASRIEAKRTAFVDELNMRQCMANNTDALKAKKCIENSKLAGRFSFFTDRCSESDYFIGINGKEVQLHRISKKPGRPTNFIGSFVGSGYKVSITNARLIKKTYIEGGARNEDNVDNAEYKVDVTITKGTLNRTFKDVVLCYGR